MSDSRIRPSPARSLGQGVSASPRRASLRKTRSVSSPARSTASGRLSAVIRLQDMDSFRLSPMPTRRSVLNDDTDIAEETRRRSWWKKLSNNSRDLMMEVLNENKVLETNEAIEEFIDIEVLSQEKKNYTMDIPDSSDSESISSIVIPQRKLFTEKENKPQKKFSQILGSRRSSAKLHKTTDNDKTVTVAPRNLFNHPSKAKSKPVFPAELLTISPEKIANKTKEIAAGEVKVQVRPLFGNRASTKRKNMFIDFIVSESEDEISEIQPRVFGFQKKGELQPESSNAQRRDPSPTSSITTDVEMDEWKHLPSSTMVENELEYMMADKTPVKKPKLSKLSTINTSVNKTKQSDKDKSLNSSKVLTHNQSKNHEVQQNKNKRYGENSLTEDVSINVNAENKKPVVEEIQNEFDADIEMDNDGNAVTDNHLNTDKAKNSIITNNQSLTLQNNNISRTKPNESIKSKNLTENCDPANASLNKSKQIPTKLNTSQTKNDTNANINVTEKADKSKTHNKSNNSITLKDNQSLNTQQKAMPDKDIADKQSLKEASVTSQKHSRVISESEINNQNQQDSGADEENEVELSLHYESEEDNESHLVKSVLNDEETSVEQENDSQDDTNNHDNKSQEEIQNESCIKNTDIQNEEDEYTDGVIEESKHENNDEDNKVEPNEHQDKIDEDEPELNELSINRNKSEVKDLEEPEELVKSQVQDKSKEEQNQTEDELEQNVETQEETEEKQLDQSVEEQNEEGLEQSLVAEVQTEEEQEQSEEELDQSVEAQEQSVEAQEQSEEEQEQNEEEIERSEEEQEPSEEEQEQSDDEQEQSIEEQDQSVEEQEQSIEEQERSIEEQDQSVEKQDQSVEDQEQSEEEQVQGEEEQVQSEEEQAQSEEEHELEESQEVEPLESSAEIEDSNENNAQIDNDVDMENDADNEVENTETPNVSHDTTGRNRKKEHSKMKSPEAVLHDKTKQMESFMTKGRNTSLRRTSIMKSMNIRTSLAPPRESTGLSDGTRNSSAEGSGWDSHRTTRKTLRQTFGRDFSPRKSLRALVMEKSAKRQTAITDITSVTSKFPQANSTELPEDSNVDENDCPAEANHDVSKRTRQTTLEMYLQKIKKQNIEKKMKMEEAIRNSLKAPPKDITNIFKVPTRPPFAAKKSSTKVQNKPKAKQIKSNLLFFEDLPEEVKVDMKYKPPKRFQPNDAAWITKRLYKTLETKLEPKYDYKARVRAEKLVQSIYQFSRELKRREVAPPDAVELLKQEMARLDVVKTHFEFYQFFREYMPREIRIKVIPDIVNKIPMPRQGIFSDILRGNTMHE